MKKILATILTVAFTSQSGFAASTRTLTADSLQSSDLSKTWTPPAASDTIVGRASTDTLTNKSISGATNTLTAIPASAISSGQIAVANGGTGLSSGTSGGILGYTASGTLASSAALGANAIVIGGGAGATPTALGSTGTTTTLLHGNAAGAPTFGAVSLTADVSGTLGVGNGGTGVANPTSGSVYIGAGSSPMTAVAPGTSGNVLTSNGSTWQSTAPASTSPNVTGTQASPISVVAATGVVFSGTNYHNTSYIQGSGGAVTVSASPQIAAATTVGQRLRLIGTSATNTVTLADGTGLSLNGPITMSNNSAIELDWNGSVWTEISRR